MKEIKSLYLHYKHDVYCYLMSLTHNPTLSEDLLSETFLAAINSLPTFKRKSSVKTWLFGIARNLWLQHLRQHKPLVEYNDLMEIYLREGMENHLITKQAILRIKKLLATKDIRTQKIISRRVEGYSYREIAAEAGISENSARVIGFRVKRWLKSILEKEDCYE